MTLRTELINNPEEISISSDQIETKIFSPLPSKKGKSSNLLNSGVIQVFLE